MQTPQIKDNNYLDMEFRPLQEQEEIQRDLIKHMLVYIKENSPFYQKSLSEYCDKDFNELPFTTKEDIAKHNRDLLCVPENQIAESVSTSGSTGKPVYLHLTSTDLHRLADVEGRAFSSMGIKNGDKVLLAVTLDRLFMAGMAYYLGVAKAGARSLRIGPGQLGGIIELIKELKPQSIVAVPSTLKMLCERLQDEGVPNPLKKALLIGEPIRDDIGESTPHARYIQETTGMQLFSSYGISEIQGSFVECDKGCGAHLHTDLMHVEITNEDGQILKDGEYGEVVITSLGVTGMPLLRFKTGDIASLDTTPCLCGRKSPRISPIRGRLAQRLKVKGVNIFPNQVYRALDRIEDVTDYYIEAHEHSPGCDRLIVHCHTENNSLSEKDLASTLGTFLRVTPEVIFSHESVIKSTIRSHSNRKTARFIDRRPSVNKNK
ncbi:MAG: AMP-binding protein [Planctomycetes bacterium]|nr:AMP-binding protein [Planctomycetota bacterium]